MEPLEFSEAERLDCYSAEDDGPNDAVQVTVNTKCYIYGNSDIDVELAIAEDGTYFLEGAVTEKWDDEGLPSQSSVDIEREVGFDKPPSEEEIRTLLKDAMQELLLLNLERVVRAKKQMQDLSEKAAQLQSIAKDLQDLFISFG